MLYLLVTIFGSERQLTDSSSSPAFHDAFLVSIVVSIPACHAGDPGSIPGRGVRNSRTKLLRPSFCFVVGRAETALLFCRRESGNSDILCVIEREMKLFLFCGRTAGDKI